MDASLNKMIYFYYIWHCLIRHIFTIKHVFKALFILKIFQYKIYFLPDMSILQIIQSHRGFKNNKIITLLTCSTRLDWAGPAIRMCYLYGALLWLSHTQRGKLKLMMALAAQFQLRIPQLSHCSCLAITAPQQARIHRTSQARTDRRHSSCRRRPIAA